MSGIEEALAAGGAAEGGGTAGAAASAGEGLIGAAPGTTMSGAPAFGSSAATPFSFSGAPTNSGAAAAAGAPAATATPAMMNMQPTKSGGYGDTMKGLMSGNSGQTATDLMKIAASRQQPAPPGIPSLPARSGGGGTQPSIQQFLQMLSQQRGAGLRLGG